MPPRMLVPNLLMGERAKPPVRKDGGFAMPRLRTSGIRRSPQSGGMNQSRLSREKNPRRVVGGCVFPHVVIRDRPETQLNGVVWYRGVVG
jgi:hypothetical protein